VLTPQTIANCGRVPDSVQPNRKPAEYAPLSDPLEIASISK